MGVAWHPSMTMASASARPVARSAHSSSALSSSVSTLGEKIKSVVSHVRENFKASTDLYDFIKVSNRNGISVLYVVSHAYSDCMEAAGVRTKAELQQLCRQHYSDVKVKVAVETLLEGEKSFTEFLVEVERELIRLEDESVTNNPAMVGQVLPKNLTLLDVSTSQHSTIEAYWKGTKFTLFVVVRHFG